MYTYMYVYIYIYIFIYLLLYAMELTASSYLHLAVINTSN
jgi:hypothetical protein